MTKKATTPAKAAAAEAENKVTFNLNEIGYDDLDGNRIKLNFDQKEFGNILYANAQTIETDRIAKDIHAVGVTECTAEDARLIMAIIDHVSNYTYRVKSALRAYIEFLTANK